MDDLFSQLKICEWMYHIAWLRFDQISPLEEVLLNVFDAHRALLHSTSTTDTAVALVSFCS